MKDITKYSYLLLYNDIIIHVVVVDSIYCDVILLRLEAVKTKHYTHLR